MEAFKLLIDGDQGLYIPKIFCNNFDFGKWEGIDEKDVNICKDPNNVEYFDAWNNILGNAICKEFIDGKEYIFTLWHDGDLWLLCNELMTEKEYYSFYGEERCQYESR